MKWVSLVLLAGLLAASPFLTNRALGTNEAYNYSLSVADAVTQFRSGAIPMLVGQTEYAFNGRIHPTRTAPGLAYATSLLDFVTFRQLGFWTLQNLVLGLAIVGGAVACFLGLRTATPASPGLAAILACLYVLSAPVLAAAYAMDLYMTVLAVPFIPLAYAGNLRCLTGHWRPGLTRLAVALAACWLAHPPVALWLTLVSLPLQIAALLLRPPRGAQWAGWLAAPLLFLVLGGFAIASALTATTAGNLLGATGPLNFMPALDEAFAASLLPVSHSADQLGDFQLGYAFWLLAGTVVLAARRQACRPAAMLLALAGLLLCFTIPVPGITRWLWTHSPALVITITGPWPMQRLYLLVVGLLVFAAAYIRPPSPRQRPGLLVVGIAAGLWTLSQAAWFVWRGFQTHRTADETARTHEPSNINLTPISYAFARIPSDFVHGVRDPAAAFRVLAPYDLHELASNLSIVLPPDPERVTGQLALPAGGDGRLFTAPDLLLQPGRRYRLDLEFLVPPFAGQLVVRGPQVHRGYALPAAGGPRGFGMNAGNVPRLPLWTDSPVPEPVTLSLSADRPVAPKAHHGAIATFTLSPVTDEAMPIQLLSLVPLQVRVDSPAPGYLETPRIFLRGYRASVNGHPVRTQRSPEGLVLLPVPAGRSVVHVYYAGPWFVAWSFWLGCVGWLGVAVAGLARISPCSWRQRAAAGGARLAAVWSGHRIGIGLGLTVALLGATIVSLVRTSGSAAPATTGPVRIRFALPRGETNRQQPLLVTGRPQAGLFVYVVYHDPEHVRIGVDVWGVLGTQTEPIRTDYFAEHEVTIEAGSLYPRDAVSQVGTRTTAASRLRVTFDGATVIDHDVDTYPSTPAEVTVGRNLIGGSSCEPRFAGEILSVERLPVPAR